MPFEGACLCGQTTIVLKSDHAGQAICHCWDCKQTSGSAFTTAVMASQKDITITGPTKAFEYKGPSGKTVSRIFCGNCGSAISQKAEAFGEGQVIQTGNFRGFATVPIIMELFVKDRWTGLAAVKDAEQIQTQP